VGTARGGRRRPPPARGRRERRAARAAGAAGPAFTPGGENTPRPSLTLPAPVSARRSAADGGRADDLNAVEQGASGEGRHDRFLGQLLEVVAGDVALDDDRRLRLLQRQATQGRDRALPQ